MYYCPRCKEYKGVITCNLCQTLYCSWCEDEKEDTHIPEEHGYVYNYYEYLDAMRERWLERNM